MDSRSELQLQSVMPEFAEKIRAAASQLQQAGTYLLVVSGVRTAAQQDALYAQGRTLPGHIVTNAKAGQSMHNYGLAADIVPYLSGPAGALNWTVSTPQYQEMVSALKEQGLTWGGDWKHLADYDHFQWGGLPNSPTAIMYTDYGNGNSNALKFIWDNVTLGKYKA